MRQFTLNRSEHWGTFGTLRIAMDPAVPPAQFNHLLSALRVGTADNIDLWWCWDRRRLQILDAFDVTNNFYTSNRWIFLAIAPLLSIVSRSDDRPPTGCVYHILHRR